MYVCVYVCVCVCACVCVCITVYVSVVKTRVIQILYLVYFLNFGIVEIWRNPPIIFAEIWLLLPLTHNKADKNIINGDL